MYYDIGLIIEGGGMRGTYAAGVIDFFIENDIYFKNIYAVSAGACHACSYISKQRGRAFKTVSEFIGDKRYLSVSSLIRTGNFFGAEFMYHTVPEQLLPYDYDTALKYEGTFYAVATNCLTGQAEYLPVNNIREEIIKVQASASLPVLSKMVPIDGSYYFDGGIADSIPLKHSIESGNIKNIAILTRERGFVKPKSAAVPLMRVKYGRKFPKLVEAQRTRHIRYNEALDLVESEEKKHNLLVIQPHTSPGVGRFEKDVSKLTSIYKMGYEDAQKHSDEIKQFISAT